MDNEETTEKPRAMAMAIRAAKKAGKKKAGAKKKAGGRKRKAAASPMPDMDEGGSGDTMS